VTSPQSAPTFSYSHSHWPLASHHQRSPTQKMELQESWLGKLYSRHRTFHSADSCQQHQHWGIISALLWCYAESSPPFHSTRLPPNVHSVFGWGVPRFTEAVRGVWWPRHSWPSHRVPQCSSPASLGRTDVEDELHALKTEELGTWYAGLVLLNNHPSQLIRQSAPTPLPRISSR